jgi:hypothetical protein
MNNEKLRFGEIWLFLILLPLIFTIASCSKTEDAKPKEVTKDQIEASQPPKWLEEIKKTAISNQTESEKADAISLLASNYQPIKEEVQEFEDYIIDEFTQNKYLSDIDNHEYMLTNLFKCRVVEDFYDDKEQQPIDRFAYDYFQNINYLYRGSDILGSEEIKLNEEHMNQALAEMQ